MLDHKKLAELRKNNNWTYPQMLGHLAAEQGVYCTTQSMAAYEKGRTKNCPPHLLLAIARLYCVKPEELLIDL